jgi:DNA polymerase
MAKYFLNQSISQVHGKARKQDNVICYAMYHPAAALHQGSLRKIIEVDMLKIPQILAQAEKLTEAEAEPQQLSLF